MPQFHFKAVDLEGRRSEGQREAKDAEALIAQLQQQGLIPISIRPAGILTSLLHGRRRMGSAQLNALTTQLAALMDAGLTLDRALGLLIELNAGTSAHRLLTDIQTAVRNGASLSDALEIQGEEFSQFYVNMVRAGEHSGTLSTTLIQLADYLERRTALQDSIRSALIYPMLLTAVAGISVLLLLTWVVPRFAAIFEDMGAPLPLSTQLVIGIGEYLQDSWHLLLGLCLSIIIGIRLWMQDSSHRNQLDAWMLSLPLFGALIWKMETARFSQSLSTLLANGLTLVSGISLATEVVVNAKVRAGLEASLEALKHGRGIAAPLQARSVFPPLALQLIRVGEESGQLDQMLAKVAELFEQETRASVQRLLALLEPSLIIVLGLLVAGIILSILTAILGANQLLF